MIGDCQPHLEPYPDGSVSGACVTYLGTLQSLLLTAVQNHVTHHVNAAVCLSLLAAGKGVRASHCFDNLSFFRMHVLTNIAFP